MKREPLSKLRLPDDSKKALLIARKYFKARTLFIIGSTARRDTNAYSDLDVLIFTNTNIRSALFYQNPTIKRQTLPISVITYSPKNFLQFWENGSLFVYHVLQEGILVWDDGTFREMASRPFHLKEDFSDDIREQFDKLKAFRDPRAFNGIFTHVYARLWSVYKNIVFFSLAQRGKPEFAKKKALNLFYRFYPNLRRLRTSFDGLYYFYCIAFKDVDLPHPHIHQTQKQLLKYLSMFNILERGLK